jgi:sterol desaturase/sphingolipid hydroxylase (fatty acid hydroxylase superfamily)
VSPALWFELTKLQWTDFLVLQLGALAMFFGLSGVEGLLARRASRKPPPELLTDLFYWLLIPSVRVVSRLIALVLLVACAVALGMKVSAATLYHGFGPLARQPTPLIVLELLLFMDLLWYWSHRLFHRVPLLWRFHAIHHSATTIRWSTTGRVHPVNEIINYAITIVACFLVGFPISVVLPLVPVMVVYAVAAHTQWNPSLGPLRHVFAGPRFHRWHHTLQAEGGNKNFANVFSFWDRMFGTYHLPEGRVATVFGLDGETMPESYWAQLRYPFRRAPRRTPAPSAQPSAVGAATVPSVRAARMDS